MGFNSGLKGLNRIKREEGKTKNSVRVICFALTTTDTGTVRTLKLVSDNSDLYL